MKINKPKHKHRLDREIHRSFESMGSNWVQYRATFIWSCKKCPYLKKKVVLYYE